VQFLERSRPSGSLPHHHAKRCTVHEIRRIRGVGGQARWALDDIQRASRCASAGVAGACSAGPLPALRQLHSMHTGQQNASQRCYAAREL
jgi:hypothetical protein